MLTPENFIKKFVRQNIVIKGKRNFALYGKAGKKGLSSMETLKLGTYNSDVYLKLYNKTKEQRIKFKKHIFDFWKANGYLLADKSIFRLEFTIQNNFELYFQITENIKTKIKTINFDTILNPNFLSDVYYQLIEKYFSFKINGNDSNKARLKDYNFINKPFAQSYIFARPDVTGITGRSEKVFTNKLETLLHQDFYKGEIEEAAIKVLRYTHENFHIKDIEELGIKSKNF